MASWRTARSLVTLLAEMNSRWPGRSSISDGTIGDPAHMKRDSRHNPDENGVVCAADVTSWVDPTTGLNVADEAVRIVVARKDPRIGVIIRNDRIIAGNRGPQPWVWRPYQPTNPRRNQHRKHAHFDVVAAVDDTSPWGIAMPTTPSSPAQEDDVTPEQDYALNLILGAVGRLEKRPPRPDLGQMFRVPADPNVTDPGFRGAVYWLIGGELNPIPYGATYNWLRDQGVPCTDPDDSAQAAAGVTSASVARHVDELAQALGQPESPRIAYARALGYMPSS